MMRSKKNNSILDGLNQPHVSVVVPAYNAAHTISQAINSILAQSFIDFELIICNDASIDKTQSILETHFDYRLQIITNEKNLGAGLSRDRAIAISKGEWLAFGDADDLWQPNRLEKLLQAAGADTNVMVFDDIMICHDVNNKLVPWRPLHGRRDVRDVCLEDYLRSDRLLIKPIIPAHIVKKNQLRHSNRRFAEDAEFFIRVALAGARLRYLPEPLYLYRIAPGSATAVASDTSLMRRCLEDCMHIDNIPETVQRALMDKIAALRVNESLYKLAAICRQYDFGQAIKLIRQEPKLLRILPRRLSKHLVYQIHRVIHGGRPR